MRIRKLPGRSTLGFEVKHRAIGRQPDAPHPTFGPAQARPDWPLKVPTADSLPDPEVNHLQVGLFKYTTGVLTISKKLAGQLQGTGVAWKVYTERPINGDVRIPLLRTCAEHAQRLDAGDTPSVLRYHYSAAFDALKAFPGARNIFLQTFGNTRRGFPPIPGSRRAIDRAERSWTTKCRLYRPSCVAVEVCRPYFTLAINGIVLWKHCNLSFRAFPDKIPWKITIGINGHMKPTVYTSNVSSASKAPAHGGEMASGTIQRIVDAVVDDLARAFYRKIVKSAEETLALAEKVVLANMRASSLAPVLDFDNLQLELVGNRKMRSTHNRSLNADGTPRTPLSEVLELSELRLKSEGTQGSAIQEKDERSAVLPPALESERERRTLEPAKHLVHSFYILNHRVMGLSTHTRRKLGSDELQISTYHNSRAVGLPHKLRSHNICQQLETFCENSNGSGLALALSFSHHLAEHLKQATNVMLMVYLSSFSHDLDAAHVERKASRCSYQIYSEHPQGFGPAVSIILPTLSNMSSAIPDPDEHKKFSCGVTVTFRRSRVPTTSSEEVSTLASRLTHAAFATVQQVLTGMTFENYECVSGYLSEGLLRTLGRVSQVGELAGVKVNTFGRGLPECRTVAFWKEDERDATPAANSGTKVVSFSSMQGQSTTGKSADGALVVSEVDCPTGTVPESGSSKGGLMSEHNKAIPADGVTISKNNLPLLVVPPNIRSSGLSRATGFSFYGFAITWDSWHESALSSVTKSTTKVLVDQAIESAPGHNLLTLQKVVMDVREALPSCPKVRLSIRHHGSRFESGYGNTLDLQGYHEIRLTTDDVWSKSAPVAITLPHVRCLLSQNGQDGLPAWVGVTLRGSLTQASAEGSDEDLPSALMRTLETIGKVATPILAGADSTEHPDILAGRIALALEKAPTLLIPHLHLVRIETSVAVFTIGAKWMNPHTKGRASALLAASGQVRLEPNDEVRLELNGKDEPDLPSDEEEGSSRSNKASIGCTADTAVPDSHGPCKQLHEENGSAGTFGKNEPHARTEPCTGGVFVALGSNVGDRFEAIEAACRAIDEDDDMRIVQTSSLFETEPMYVEDQERFLNGACEIDTQLEPLELLDRLQAIENNLGRVKTIDKGPRNIDLDILLYKGQTFHNDRLTIPHALMTERAFVLRPLKHITDNGLPLYPLKRTANGYLNELGVRHKDVKGARLPLGPGCEPITLGKITKSTRVMSILNVTPDSFSDGGVNMPADIEALKATVANHIAAGATIIDIGGQSSRPNAPDITAEEEIARILPAIEAVRSLPEGAGIAISVDTYRAAVAEAAVKAGAHIVNDISAGQMDPDMLPTVARLGCTYVVMHMRGTPATMQSEENCSYPNGLIPTVVSELRERVDAAQKAGIRRWRMILDPGVGFAKTQEQNVELLGSLSQVTKAAGLTTHAWLVGSSRKGFVGKITGVQEAKERSWGTAATVTAAVQGGADIVRVHDVREMAQVVKMADAMYKVKR